MDRPGTENEALNRRGVELYLKTRGISLTAQQLDDFYEHSERQMAQSLLEARLQRNLLQARFSPWGKNANEDEGTKPIAEELIQEAIRNQTVSEFPSPKMLSEVRALDRTLDPRSRAVALSLLDQFTALNSDPELMALVESLYPRQPTIVYTWKKGPLTTPGLSAQLVAIDHGFGGDNVFAWFARDLDGSPALQLDVIDQ